MKIKDPITYLGGREEAESIFEYMMKNNCKWFCYKSIQREHLYSKHKISLWSVSQKQLMVALNDHV